MALICAVPPVRLFVGILYHDAALCERAKPALEKILGAVDYASSPRAFDFTSYYEAEMGADLSRIFFSFRRLVSPDELIEIKYRTNALEEELSGGKKRSINIDPGYIDYYKVVLVSAKFAGQRMYMGRGIYGELTLLYEKGAFKPMPWSFPDFRSGAYHDILLKIRTLYRSQMKAGSSHTEHSTAMTEAVLPANHCT
ncbi:MAG: DUF4416 family protein [Candidatus Xenobiia bacterium LiM19]